MNFQSVNPFNGDVVAEWPALTHSHLTDKLERSQMAFLEWRQVGLANRSTLLRKAATILREDAEKYAVAITTEMGKPLVEARAEVEKCAWVCEFYADNASDFLADEVIPSDAKKSYVRHDPLGTVLAIMPWNFPFWQVFRFAAPTLMAGNTALLKHAPNVFGCARLIETVFERAGFPEGVFQSLIVHHDTTESIIRHQAVQAVSLTGSDVAGASVAAIAGKHLKKSLLELGGSNAFVVLDDADIDAAVSLAVTARMLNAGQSCIAAKRILVAENIHDEFVKKFNSAVQKLRVGDPLDESTQIGPLARIDLADNLRRQVEVSVQQGAQLVTGGNQRDCFFEPTVLNEVTPDMPVFKEETFGPVASITPFSSVDDALKLASTTSFGLGISICTSDVEAAERLASEVVDGAFFVNELVKSDPRLPFGGTRKSGYGRELSRDGILEFVNRKTVYIK